MNKTELLENAVLTGTTQEVAEILRSYPGINVREALTFACRFRGLEYVKVIVESGAVVPSRWWHYRSSYWISLLKLSDNLDTSYFIKLNYRTISQVTGTTRNVKDKKPGKQKTLKLLPLKQRTDIVSYLMQNVDIECFDPGELLFYAIIGSDKQMTAALKKMGVTFSKKRIAALTEGRLLFERIEFLRLPLYLKDREYLDVLRNIIKEIGEKKLRYSKEILFLNYDPELNRFLLVDPEFFKFLLENFEQEHMDKIMIMYCVINEDSTACIEICAENGWLSKPSTRDEIIMYASENEKTKCLAWLLDYKNRNFDLAAELEKAEKKAWRELNAPPDSITALRLIWNWKKQEDGTLVITGYKGDCTEVEVPSKIGGGIVTAIGRRAFSSASWKRLTSRQLELREYKLTKVTLPKGILVIGDEAFNGCRGLTKINIPDGVVKIGDGAFANCDNLTDITLPESVRELGMSAFFRCWSLRYVEVPKNVTEIRESTFYCGIALKTVVVPASVTKIGEYNFTSYRNVVVEPGSFAEEYCKQNDIPFRYIESEENT